MDRKTTILITLTLIFLKCYSIKSQGNSIDSMLKHKFNQKEIKELERIIDFFDSLVLNETKTDLVDSAYHLFM
jgi:hypothetical protein